MGAWRTLIDGDIPAIHSVLRRYRRALAVVGLELGADELAQVSLGEGASLLRLPDRGGVAIFVCDETRAMHTGTYKALDACVTAALLRREGVRRVVASSGGNLSAALGAYCQRADVEALLFQPTTTLFKQDRAWFAGGSRLIGAELHEPAIKSLAQGVARRFGIVHVPDVRWRLAASAARAMFLLEAAEQVGAFDFVAQTVCAGHGPAGVFTFFDALRRRGMLCAREVPRLLGFQQEANAPIVRAWRAGDNELGPEHLGAAPERYVEPGLYNTNPGRDYGRLAALMRAFGGSMCAITTADWERRSDEVRATLDAAGLRASTLPTGEMVEKTGLLTGVGIFAAIEAGLLRPGERVLWMLTGGVRELGPGARPVPDLMVDGSRTEAAWIEVIGRHFGLERVDR